MIKLFKRKIVRLRLSNPDFKSISFDRDIIWKKSRDLVDNETKSEYWEYNHNRIICTISTLMQENGRMPLKFEIVTKTGLSRPTIHKQIKEYSSHPLYLASGTIQSCKRKSISKVFRFAVNGDIKSVQLFLEFTRDTDLSCSPFNNYIQINQVKITQDNIQQLTVDHVSKIGAILLQVFPKP